MPTPEKRLRLMQLASNSLPVGGYSWSQGLEWAVEAGWVEDSAAFEHWQQLQMEQSFFAVDLPLLARLPGRMAQTMPAKPVNRYGMARRTLANIRFRPGPEPWLQLD